MDIVERVYEEENLYGRENIGFQEKLSINPHLSTQLSTNLSLTLIIFILFSNLAYENPDQMENPIFTHGRELDFDPRYLWPSIVLSEINDRTNVSGGLVISMEF
jgi:hypothetical protein